VGRRVDSLPSTSVDAAVPFMFIYTWNAVVRLRLSHRRLSPFCATLDGRRETSRVNAAAARRAVRSRRDTPGKRSRSRLDTLG